jgi:hypothetical protein
MASGIISGPCMRNRRTMLSPSTATSLKKGKWRPIVTVSIETKRADIITRRLPTPVEWAFDTERESDERGYQLGAWIDERS